jgi:hypothetical protein
MRQRTRQILSADHKRDGSLKFPKATVGDFFAPVIAAVEVFQLDEILSPGLARLKASERGTLKDLVLSKPLMG